MAFIDFEPEDAGGGFVDFDAEPAPSTDRGILGSVADIGLTAAKGAIGVPETVVGIADLLTFGQAGKLAEEAGFRPKEAKAMLDQFYTPAQQAANEAVKVPGFLETLKAAIQNPSTILHAAIESTPSMLGGGVIARGLLKAAPAMAPLAAGAIGEGVVTAGQNAEQLRQETPGGTLTAGQSALMAGSGALTGLLGFAGGRAAKKLGIADIDTWLAKGGSIRDLAQQPGLLKRVSGGMLSEGVFEELPQSAQEQIAQNIALQKPWNENVGNAAAMGMLVGTVMGGGANVLAPGTEPAPPFVPQNIPAPIETAGRVMSAPTLDAAIAETANAALGPAPRFERMLDESAAGGLIDSAIRQQQFDRAQGQIEVQKAREERQILLDSRNQQADEAITAAETPPLREPFSATPAGTPPNTALADELKRARELYTLRRMEALGIKGTDEQGIAPETGTIAPNADIPILGAVVPNQGIPADAEISPKTVGGIPVSAQSTEQLQAIVQNPETPPTTRHAAVAAIQARAQNPETRQEAPGQAQVAPLAEGIAAAPPAQGAQALQNIGTSGQVPSNRNIPGPAVAEKATIAAEKATPTYTGPKINGQAPSAMTPAQLQYAAKNAPFWDQKDAAAEELKRRDKTGETFGGRSADQWTDKEVDLLARRSSKPALKAAARAEGDRRAAADIELADRMKSAGTAEQLQQFAGEAGWAEKGGFLIRVKTGDRAGEEKVSRTSWVPRAEWWPGRPVQENEKFYREAVAKAIAGESLTRKQKDVVRFLMGLAEDELVGAQVEPDTTPIEARVAQAGIDAIGDAPDGWNELSEEKQNDRLDSYLGEDSRPAAQDQEAGAQDAQGEVGQTEPDEPGSLGQARRVYNPNQQGIDFGGPAAKAEGLPTARAEPTEPASTGAPEAFLKPETNAQIAEREAKLKAAAEATAKANAAAERAQAGKPVTADQRDIFNDQGGLFDRPAKDLSAADALRLAAAKMDEAAKPQEGAANRSEAATAPAKAGDFFTVDRLIDGEMRTVTFQRGEYAKALMSGSEDAGTSKWDEGEITGISQARREAKIGEGDLWYGFGSIYKAERPVEAAPKGERVTLSSAIEESNAKHGSGLTEADRVPGSIGGAESRQSSAAYMADQTQTEAFKRWSNNAPLITSAQADSHGFKTGERVVLEAFHGTKRPDRVGERFKKSRATSGPMAFHTSSPELASGYAQGKSDTSLANEDQNYANWFKFKPKGERSSTDIVRAWYRLGRETQDKISEIAPTLRRSEDGNAVISEAGNKSGNGSYDYNLSETQRGYGKRGNPLAALVEDWLNSGVLFGDEEVFMDVLRMAGFPTKDVTYDSPHSEFPFVYKNYIAMQNPLVTSDVPQSVMDALNAAAKRDRSRAQPIGADMWDKNNRTLRSWVDALNEPSGAKYVWTSIPDKVTDILKSLGYDGIIDWSGKNSGVTHPVYIPFHENQVKSAIGNKGTFSTDKNNILRQRKSEYNDRQLELIYENHDLRPGTTQKQKDQGIHAIRSLFGGDRRAGATLLGSSIWADFKARLGSELIGQKVRFAQDLAILAQILRDPRFETLRFFFVKDGKVIEHIGVTSRMPGSVSFIGRIKAPAGNVVPIDESAAYARLSNEAFDEKAAEIKAAMQRAGADGYYVLHNHPGGLATPSSSDRNITQRFAKQIPGFKGHVVIDHNEYAVINRDGTNSMHSIKSPQNEAPEVAHDMLGQKIGGPLDLIAVAKNIQAKRGFSVLIGQGGSDGRVTAIAEVPSALLNGKTKMEQMKALVRLRRFGRFSGSSSVFVVSENPTSHDYLIENGAARDVVSTAGLSRRADGVEVKRESQYATGSVRAEQPNNKTDTPAFKRWFGDSKVVDAGGKPLVVYHGTNRKFNEFEPAWKQLDRIMKPYEKTDGGSMQRYYEIAKSEPEIHFFTEDEGIAEGYADQSGEPTVIQAYIRIENPAVDDTRDQGSRDRALDAMIANGNDGAIFWDTSVSGRYSHRAYAVRTSTQIKSATGNRGTYELNNPSIFEQAQAPYWVNQQPADTQEALRKAGVWHAKPTLKAHVAEWSKDWQKRLKQGVVDQFSPIKEYDYHAYMLARMARGADNALDGLLNYGTVYLDNDGAVDVNFERGGFLGIMSTLKGEHDRFLAWVIGNRAERLLAEGREHNFTPQDVANLKTLNQGQMTGGASRAQEYARVRAELDRYNKAVLDIAEKAGLIDAAGRVTWEKDFYVPFYRLMEDEAGKQQGPIPSKGLVNQYAFKVLKGGEQALGDPMENILKNWSHLLDASLKNQAARESLLAAQRIGAVVEGDEATVRQMAKAAGLKDAVVSFTDQGVQRWFMVEDAFLLDAMKAIGFTGFQGTGMKVMQKFKKWLTMGVTVSPTFRIRNVIRDSLQMIGANPASYNVLGNVLTGWKATKADSPEYASILAGGGVMRFGTILDGDRAEHVKRLIASGVDDQTILTTPERVKDALQQAWDWWQTVGDRAENVNRAALYKKLRADGKTHLEASFAARDTMDFSMQGTWAAIRFLSQTVPFFNARLQGLYKLGRGAAEDPRRFGIVVGGATMASLALLMAYSDDDDWKKREDFDRDTFWMFKVGDKAFRIPKPFEIGAIATIAERGAEAMMTDELTGKQFAQRVFSIVSQQLSMNPVPQLAMPLIELYANRDSFTDRPIEGMGMERMSKPRRIAPYTSATAQLLGKNGLVSPVQIDHLVNGYFGWLGAHVVATADLALRPAMGLPGKPAWRTDEVLVVGDFVKDLPQYQSKYVTRVYDQMKEVQQAMADLKELQKVGSTEEAKKLLEKKGDKIRMYRLFTNAEKQLADVNRKIKMVQYRAGDAESKRARLDALYATKNRIAKTTEQRAKSLQQ